MGSACIRKILMHCVAPIVRLLVLQPHLLMIISLL